MRPNQIQANPQSYFLKVWKVWDNGMPVWKAMLVSIETNESHSFPNLESLYTFLNGVSLTRWSPADETRAFDPLLA